MTSPGFSGKDISGQVEILRDNTTKTASIEIRDNISWKVYAGSSDTTIDMSRPVAQGKQAGLFPLDVPAGRRSYFAVKTSAGSAILAERHLPMEGAYNVRDIGGFINNERRVVRWGKLFRSDEMNRLTEADINYLSTIPIVSLVDFRAQDEIKLAADKIPASVGHHLVLSVTPGNLMEAVSDELPSEEQAAGLMEKMNRMMVTDPEVIGQYKKFFAALADEENLPLMYHCTAGKDRTGLATALILFALDVNEETIMSDYLASNGYLRAKYGALMKEYPLLIPLLEVRPSYLGSALEQIRESYGSVENFLTDVLEVDKERMKELFLY